MDDPLMTAAGVIEDEILVRRRVESVRNPAIAALVTREGSAPKASAVLLAEMIRRGYTASEVTGVGEANVKRIARTVR